MVELSMKLTVGSIYTVALKLLVSLGGGVEKKEKERAGASEKNNPEG